MLKKLKNTMVLVSLTAVLLLGIVFAPGCMGSRGAVSAGWAGGIVNDDVLYLGSMKGNLVSIDLTDGSIIQSLPLEKAASSGGFLSCGQAASRVVIYSSPVIAGDLAVITGNGNGSKIYAFPTEEVREEPRWVYPRDTETVIGTIVGSVVYDGTKLFFGTASNRIFALDAKDGFKEWETEISDMIWSTPAVDDDTLYIGSFDKKLYAVNTADGSIKWEFETEGAIVAPAVVSGSTVFIGSFDRNLYALNAETGTLKWQYRADNWFWARPVLTGDTLYAPCLDGKVYALDIADGSLIQEYDYENPISSSPVLVNGLLISATQEGKIYSISVNDGTDRGVLAALDKTEKIYADLFAADGKVYVHSNADTVYEIDAENGAKREIIIEIESE
jgi:outer membrane protein assembly factor BamB